MGPERGLVAGVRALVGAAVPGRRMCRYVSR
jgi:hypothetical protein